MNIRNLKASLISAIIVLCLASIGGYLWYLYESDVPVNDPIDIPVDQPLETTVEEPVTQPQEVVSIVSEKFIAPLVNAEVVRPFFSLTKSKDQQVAAIIEYEGVYRANYGVDYASDTSSDVLAVASGVVQEVANDTLFGNKIVMQCGKYTVTYQSLDSISVSVGDTIKQGDIIGVSGENGYDSELSKHVHVIVEVSGRYLDLEKLVSDKTVVS
ncbi:MAG: M23 family metallopeptidase [Erysipelotrichaceae bacterium]|nr:M23 family metallopeptidase [Erysipelotrichaceae bacterium]MBQ9987199.1 M23 family metallopeptidase [Erysipelotrichales bacterium]MBR3693492.1 M23 family metallopeptidase [Erysipelotrichales bacterium]